jgi:hypothetical protein
MEDTGAMKEFIKTALSLIPQESNRFNLVQFPHFRKAVDS